MKSYRLRRRGFDLGSIDPDVPPPSSAVVSNAGSSDWRSGRAILLRGIHNDSLAEYQLHIDQSRKFFTAIVNSGDCDEILAADPYHARLSAQFESLGSSFNEGDEQEIETVFFDAIADREIVAEDLWMKVSWLSFYPEDSSLRFRFSFGVDFEEDVAADRKRQQCAAELTNAVFPESSIITENTGLVEKLQTLLDARAVNFVERIVYFNAPEGGAYLHHDRERGHAGVVYAQLTGSTYWLALSRQSLVAEIAAFIHDCEHASCWPQSIDETMRNELLALRDNSSELAVELETFSNSTLIHLINETRSFVQYLIERGHGLYLEAGDGLLLPQEGEDTCCWHSVFTIGDEAGEGLSFAVRVG